LGGVVNDILIDNGTEADFDFISKMYSDAPLSFEKVTMTKKFSEYLGKINNISKIKTGIDKIMDFRNAIPEQFRGSVDAGFKTALDKLGKAKGTEVEDYIKSVFK
jgi:aminopeptidase N